jgi:hypothetical protein
MILKTAWLVEREMFWQGDQRIKKWRPWYMYVILTGASNDLLLSYYHQ